MAIGIALASKQVTLFHGGEFTGRLFRPWVAGVKESGEADNRSRKIGLLDQIQLFHPSKM